MKDSLNPTEKLLSTESPGILHFGGARMALMDLEAGFWSMKRQVEALIGRELADSILQQTGVNGGASFARSWIEAQPAVSRERLLKECLAAYQAAGFGRFKLVIDQWPIGKVEVRAWETFESWMAKKHVDQFDSPVCAYTRGVLVGFIETITQRKDVICIERQCQALGDKAVAVDPDPGLGRNLNLLELLFERMPMVIAIIDRDFRLRRFNTTWAQEAKRYHPGSGVQVLPGANFFDLLPGTEHIIRPLFDKVLDGETVRREAVRLETKDGATSYWDIVLVPLYENGQVAAILDLGIDATGRVHAFQKLEKTTQMLKEREERLALVMRGTNDGIWDWDIRTDEVYYSPRWKTMLGYEDEEIEHDFDSWEKLVHPDDLDRSLKAIQEHLEGKTSTFILEHRLRHKDGSYRWILARGATVRDAAGVPFRMAGSHTDITDQVASQQELEARVKERTREIERRRRVAEEMRELLAALNSPRSFEEVLEYIVKEAQELLGASAAVIYRGQPKEDAITVEAVSGAPHELVDLGELPFYPESVNRALIEGRPFSVSNLANEVTTDLPLSIDSLDPILIRWKEIIRSHYRAYLTVPLVIKKDLYGALALYYHAPREFTQEDLNLSMTLGDQVALAIENAHLREQVEINAATAERSRLARDLHDAVSQTLFSASLIAEVLPKIWNLNQEEGLKRLEELRQLTRGALAEMRTLLLELRPTALEEADIRDVFRHLTDAFSGRNQIPVEIHVEGECDLPMEVKVAFYRIAQEALNNVSKHAEAGVVGIALHCKEKYVHLEIGDDGLGFDPDEISLEHLGLGIMRERAENIGANLSIHSEIDYGTKVKVIWKP